MKKGFVEYSEVSATEALRQGDVLEAIEPSAPKWQRNLLVITADCDFAHDKHQGRVTCVPLLRCDEYLMEMQLPRIRRRVATKALAVLRAVLVSSNSPNISDERMCEWPCETDPKEIISILGLDGKRAAAAIGALGALALISNTGANLDRAVDAVVEAHLAVDPKRKRENVLKEVTEVLKSSFSSPAGDALFLSAIGRDYNTGYFVYLRHLEQVWEHEIITGASRSPTGYRRISRLQDRFTHAVVQRFALVFMSIGLPDEYEEMRDLHADVLGATFK